MGLRTKSDAFKFVDEKTFGVEKSVSYGGIGLKLLLQILFVIAGVGVVYLNPAFFSNFFVSLILLLAVVGLSFAVFSSISKNPSSAAILSIAYSFVVGLAYGGIIITFEMLYPGIVIQALTALMGIIFATVFLYLTKLVKVGNTLVRFTMLFGFGFLAFLGINALLSIFGIGFYHTGGDSFYLLISLVSLALGILYLFMDYRYIDEMVKSDAPKQYEWLASTALLSTLIYLFIDLLRIIAIFTSRD